MGWTFSPVVDSDASVGHLPFESVLGRVWPQWGMYPYFIVRPAFSMSAEPRKQNGLAAGFTQGWDPIFEIPKTLA